MAGSVEKETALSICVARFITNYKNNNEYAIASTFGEQIKDFYECDELGILWSNPNEPIKKRFFGLFKDPPRRKFVGVLWFKNQAHGADGNKWFFEVYGKDEFLEIEQMVKDLADNFNVKIILYLTQEECYFEQFGYDGY